MFRSRTTSTKIEHSLPLLRLVPSESWSTHQISKKKKRRKFVDNALNGGCRDGVGSSVAAFISYRWSRSSSNRSQEQVPALGFFRPCLTLRTAKTKSNYVQKVSNQQTLYAYVGNARTPTHTLENSPFPPNPNTRWEWALLNPRARSCGPLLKGLPLRLGRLAVGAPLERSSILFVSSPR